MEMHWKHGAATTTQPSNLSNCPFCGGQPETHSMEFRTLKYGCPEITCPGNTIDATREQWNHRPESQQQADQLRELLEVLESGDVELAKDWVRKAIKGIERRNKAT